MKLQYKLLNAVAAVLTVSAAFLFTGCSIYNRPDESAAADVAALLKERSRCRRLEEIDALNRSLAARQELLCRKITGGAFEAELLVELAELLESPYAPQQDKVLAGVLRQYAAEKAPERMMFVQSPERNHIFFTEYTAGTYVFPGLPEVIFLDRRQIDIFRSRIDRLRAAPLVDLEDLLSRLAFQVRTMEIMQYLFHEIKRKHCIAVADTYKFSFCLQAHVKIRFAFFLLYYIFLSSSIF